MDNTHLGHNDTSRMSRMRGCDVVAVVLASILPINLLLINYFATPIEDDLWALIRNIVVVLISVTCWIAASAIVLWRMGDLKQCSFVTIIALLVCVLDLIISFAHV